MSAKQLEISHDSLDAVIRDELKKDSLAALLKALKKQHPADIAVALERLSGAQRKRVFAALTPVQQAEVLNEFSGKVARDLLNEMSIEQMAGLLDRLPMDEAARIISEFKRRRAAILAAMSKKHAADVQELLNYPLNSAGRMMTEKFARVGPKMTASQVLEMLRKQDFSLETLTNLYVVDEDDHLVGVVALREVVVASSTKRIEQLMARDVISVNPLTDKEEVAQLLSHYDFLAIPVVTPENKMLGVITVDDVIDVLVAAGGEDILKFGGGESGTALNEPYFTIPMKTVIFRRLGWLLLLFVAGTLTGSVLRFFETELAAVVALSFFIPLLIGTGGNTGAQTVSTLIRGLAMGEIRTRDVWRVVWREFLGGLLLGLILGAVAYVRAIVWSPDPALALAVALAIVAICTWANTIASLIPLIAHRLKIDPAAVSAPLITTLVDATGLAIYLGIAKVTMGL